MHRLASILSVAALLSLPAGQIAAQAPVQISLFPPIQIVEESEAVEGFRFALYGRNTSVTGLDLGLVTHTTQRFEGIQVSLLGLNEGSTRGVQFSGANITLGALQGAQIGVVNAAGGGEGLQWGVFNHGRNFRGLQVALVNYAESLDGIQVGLINIIRDGGVLPVMPLVNWSLR